jgi:hypothetical protein
VGIQDAGYPAMSVLYIQQNTQHSLQVTKLVSFEEKVHPAVVSLSKLWALQILGIKGPFRKTLKLVAIVSYGLTNIPWLYLANFFVKLSL